MQKNKDVLIIAEIGQAHEGSINILHSYIDAVSKTGVNAIKFQTHIAEAESSIHESFRKNFSYLDKTRYDYWKRMEFTIEQWIEIKKHCEAVGLTFLSSPFSIKAVELLESIDMELYKIGSGEVQNYLMLKKIAQTGKPIILSSGMSSFNEIDETIKFLSDFDNKLSLLQCTTSYPTKAEDVGLNIIKEFQSRYNIPIGLSDHSGTIFPAIAATALGASIIEVHTVFSKQMFGPDATSSITIDELKKLVEGVKFIKKTINNPINKYNNQDFKHLQTIFGKSIAVNKNLKKGHTLTFDDLESKKPGDQGIPANEYKTIIGKTINTDLKKYDFLKNEMINND